MVFNAHPLGALTTVSNPPAPAVSGTTVTLADATNFPDPAVVGPYLVSIWPTGAAFLKTTGERVLVTAKLGSVYTITRAQDGSSARTVLLGDNFAAATGPKDFTDIESWINAAPDFVELEQDISDIERWFTGAAPNWTASTAAVNGPDSGGAGRFDLARSGFVFKGASYNDSRRAGTILRIGDYPARNDPTTSTAYGINNAMVFITMDDLPTQVGGGSSMVEVHVVGQNSAAIPNVWGENIYVIRNSAAGDVYGSEVSIINNMGAGSGYGYVASGGGVGTNWANIAFRVTSQGTTPNWRYGLYIDAIISGANYGTGIYMTDAQGGHAGWQYGIDMTGVTGGFTTDAIRIPNAGFLRWTNLDASAGFSIREDVSNNAVLSAGASAYFYFQDSTGTKNPLAIFAADPPSNYFTAMKLTFKDQAGTVKTLAQVYVSGADLPVAGYRTLMVPN